MLSTRIFGLFLIGKSLTGLSEAIISDRVIVLFSDDLFDELIKVLERPKFKKYFSESAIEDLVTLLCEKVELIEITHHFEDCRDVKDNFLLNLAVSGRANYLVTGDADLLILNPFQGVEIISYQYFQNLILK